ncbi:MAG: radical SAM protein [Dehalococcoidia bacterium]|nr:radical SAM protein [Dehalococcoidia bacterium]
MNRYLAVNRIEFAVTYLCNSRCRHCQLGEEEERRRFPSHIDKDTAVEIVRKVGRKYNPKSVMTFGGEPLLYPEVVYAIHKEAKKVGIPVRDLITNGFWSIKIEQIQEIANNLVESGVNEVSISVDCFHQEFVPLDIVKKAAESLLKAGMAHISWNPCWVVSEGHDNLYNRKTKAILEELEKDLPIVDGEGNVAQPEGRAILWLKDFLPPRTKMPKGKCGDIPYTEELGSVKAICVEPDGRIAVCKEFYIGNAFETDIIDIIENYDPFKIPEARAIIENGMEGLMDWARAKGVKPNPEGYYNICHMCTDIRRRVNKHKSLRYSRSSWR